MAKRLDSGFTSGGICKLRELIEEYPAEVAYEFRARFNLSMFDIGSSITWLEAVLLVNVIARDNSSWLYARMNDWKYPVSREWIVAAHTYDLLHAVNSKKKPKPYPAPWPDPDKKTIGSGKKQSSEVVRNLLERMNPKEE